MDTEIIDNPEIEIEDPSSLKSAIAWWEKKRVWFNIAVGGSGIIAIFLSTNSFYLADLLGLIAYGLVLNTIYCAGFMLEALDHHYMNGSLNLFRLRIALFLMGTIASCFVTFTFTVTYYSFINIP